MVNRFLLRKNFAGITLWPFIILRDNKSKQDLTFLNHEKIHLRQQAEFLVFPFYLWYIAEFLIRLMQYRSMHLAYRNISFEREAYTNEKDLDYLKKRPLWEFSRYI